MDESTSTNSLPEGSVKLAITVEDVVKYRVPVGFLRILGLDGDLYRPDAFVQLHESYDKTVVRFRTSMVDEQGKQEQYYIRKNLDDFVFSTIDAKEIHLRAAMDTLIELKTILKQGILEAEQVKMVNDLIRDVHAKLSARET